MTDKPAPCLVCGRELEPEFKDGRSNRVLQPGDATSFTGRPMYGSRLDYFFLSGAGQEGTLTLNVCDDCLVANASRVRLLNWKHISPVPSVSEWVPEAD